MQWSATEHDLVVLFFCFFCTVAVSGKKTIACTSPGMRTIAISGSIATFMQETAARRLHSRSKGCCHRVAKTRWRKFDVKTWQKGGLKKNKRKAALSEVTWRQQRQRRMAFWSRLKRLHGAIIIRVSHVYPRTSTFTCKNSHSYSLLLWTHEAGDLR